jgi:uncharacterized protein YwqG
MQHSLSKFGGLPLAPKGFRFPKDEKGKSALFICQFHLGALKHFPTMKEFRGDGILYFFGAIGGSVSSDVFGDILVRYADKVDSLHFVTLPDDLVDYGTYPQKQLVFDEQIAMPEGDDNFVPDEIPSGEEDDCYHYLASLLWHFNREQIFALLRPSAQIPPAYLFSTYLRYANLTYHDWSDVDISVSQKKFEQLKADGMEMAKTLQWRHLFDFESQPRDTFQLNNFKGDFDRYQEGYTVMISQKDLDNMDFSKVITINHRIQVY